MVLQSFVFMGFSHTKYAAITSSSTNQPDGPRAQYFTTGHLNESEAFWFSEVETLLLLNTTFSKGYIHLP